LAVAIVNPAICRSKLTEAGRRSLLSIVGALPEGVRWRCVEWRVIGLKGKDDRNRNVRIGCRILRRLSTEKIGTWGLLNS
jgi:hypothetical protein